MPHVPSFHPKITIPHRAQWLEDVQLLRDGPNYKQLQRLDENIWSRMVYVDVCAAETDPSRHFYTYLEPTVGLMRHPLGVAECVWPGGQQVNKNCDTFSYSEVDIPLQPCLFKCMFSGHRLMYSLENIYQRWE